MVDVKMKYQASIFGDIRNIEPTPDNIKTVIDLFGGRELIPTTIYELEVLMEQGVPATNPRLAFIGFNGEWIINFLSSRIDIEKRSTDLHGENLGELDEFCREATNLFGQITNQFSKKANRIALITDFLLKEMPEETLSTVYTKLFQILKFYRDKPPFEWNWRAASNHPITLESLSETLNVITSIKRAKVKLRAANEIKVLDRIHIQIDINTTPDNREHRFDSNHIASFYNQVVELHGSLFKQVEEFING